MTPAPGEPGSDTWRGDDWRTGGAATSVIGNYDPETNLVFWGVGNGFPWVGLARPGDNLYTASTVAIDVATGTVKEQLQYTPNESWDWDEVSPPILVDYQRGGRPSRDSVKFARNGYLYFLERTSSGISFVEGMPYVRRTYSRVSDPKTGRPDIERGAQAGHRENCGLLSFMARREELAAGLLQSETRMIYAPTQENICAVMIGRTIQTTAGATRGTSTQRMYIARRGPPERSSGMARRHRQESLEPSLRKIAELGSDHDHRRRSGIQRRDQ